METKLKEKKKWVDEQFPNTKMPETRMQLDVTDTIFNADSTHMLNIHVINAYGDCLSKKKISKETLM